MHQLVQERIASAIAVTSRTEDQYNAEISTKTKVLIDQAVADTRDIRKMLQCPDDQCPEIIVLPGSPSP